MMIEFRVAFWSFRSTQIFYIYVQNESDRVCCQLGVYKINGVSRFHSNGSRKIKICWFKNLQVQIFLNWVMVSWVYFAYLIEILRFSVRFFFFYFRFFTSVFDVCQWHNVTINCFPENHAPLHSITNPTKRTKSSEYQNCVNYQIEKCSIYFTISQRHRFSDLANLEQIPLMFEDAPLIMKWIIWAQLVMQSIIRSFVWS